MPALARDAWIRVLEGSPKYRVSSRLPWPSLGLFSSVLTIGCASPARMAALSYHRENRLPSRACTSACSSCNGLSQVKESCQASCHCVRTGQGKPDREGRVTEGSRTKDARAGSLRKVQGGRNTARLIGRAFSFQAFHHPRHMRMCRPSSPLRFVTF